MEAEECKISVWVCQEEKLVSGLSRRTTCSDVVRVLLEDQSRQLEEEDEEEGVPAGRGMLSGPPHCYCIVEKWRGFERILPNKTRILRLWAAWGEEQSNVTFVLVNIEASLPNSGPRSAEARVVLSKESPCILRGPGAGTALTQEKQRRVVKKAFRKLAKINKKRKESLPKDASSVEKMETLVHLVLSQDHTIRQQVQRIKELDQEIECFEATVHLDRVQRHGANYVQDTYLAAGASPEDAGGSPLQGEELAQYEEYSRRCEEVLQLQEQLELQERLMEDVAAEIQQELNHRWMERRKGELSAKAASEGGGAPAEPGGCCEGQLLMEMERVKTQLSTSLYIGLRLTTDLETLKGGLDYSQQVWEEMEGEMRSLLETLSTVEAAEGEEVPPGLENRDSLEASGADTRTPGEGSEVWAEQEPGLCKESAGNDDDSDTGLSSMHSQDSDTIPAVCESLV